MNLCLFGRGPLQSQVIHHGDPDVIRKPTADKAGNVWVETHGFNPDRRLTDHTICASDEIYDFS
jgi:hypothetical protein